VAASAAVTDARGTAKNNQETGGQKRVDKGGQKKTPHPGFMFLCNTNTYTECIKLRLFGSPESCFKHHDMDRIAHSTVLFLFNTDRKVVYGTFRAIGEAQMNINPNAWAGTTRHTKKGAQSNRGYFPAQIRVKQESDVRVDANTKNFPAGPLNAEATKDLMQKFALVNRAPILHADQV
jgi:hypothetical protein